MRNCPRCDFPFVESSEEEFDCCPNCSFEVEPAEPSLKLRNDSDRYKELQVLLTNLAFTGEIDTPEFQSAWKASEEIKNRHGGMPPSELES
jgi:hypothetical protein